MSCRVIFRSSALTDIDDAYQWYEQQQPGLGDSFMAELGKVEALLGDNPMMFGRIRGESSKNSRISSFRRRPESIFFKTIK